MQVVMFIDNSVAVATILSQNKYAIKVIKN